jgi:hypothetical protein
MNMFGEPKYTVNKGLYKIPYREGFSKTSASFVALPVVLTSSVLVVVGFISRCIGRQLIC